MTFQTLKQSRSNFSSLQKELEKIKSPETSNYNKNDARFWRPELDKVGNGYAVIRFLPAPKSEEVPWVRIFNHGFQGPGGWYIENSLTTLNKKDPVSEANSALWNSGVEANKELARKRKRRLTYISNIYVVSDSKNPQNEGKVFLYKFGKKIFDKITDRMNPQFEDEKPVNPFDFWEGANFKLKIRKVEGFTNYDKSEFDNPDALLKGDDKELEKVYNQQHALQAFVGPSNFKTYEELKARFDRVVGGETPTTTAAESTTTTTKIKRDDDEEDVDMSYFQNLADD